MKKLFFTFIGIIAILVMSLLWKYCRDEEDCMSTVGIGVFTGKVK